MSGGISIQLMPVQTERSERSKLSAIQDVPLSYFKESSTILIILWGGDISVTTS